MTLKEISLSKSDLEVAVKNNHKTYVFYKNKHSWHSLEICKLMKTNINLFLKKSSRETYLKKS